MKFQKKEVARFLVSAALIPLISVPSVALDKKNAGDIEGIVVTTDYPSRQLVLDQHPGEKRYRVALAAKVMLLDGSKGALDDVFLGDVVMVELDSNTGDIERLTVVSQN